MVDYLFIDGNSVGFAAQGSKKLHHRGQETQAIYGFIRKLRVMLSSNPGAQPIVFWDGRSWRHNAYEGYKDGREKDPKQKAEREEFKRQRPRIAAMVQSLGVTQEMAVNLEADDLIARRCWNLPSDKTAKIISGDRDLIQLVAPNICWSNPNMGPNGKPPKLLLVTHESFAEDVEYEDPTSYVKGKAFLGDNSDNIKGVEGIGEKAAPLVVKTWPDLSEMVDDINLRSDAAIPKSLSRYKKKLKTFASSKVAQRDFLKAFRMMRLTPKYIPEPDRHRVVQTAFNAASFRKHCEECGFVSIVTDFDGWTEPFQDLSRKLAA